MPNPNEERNEFEAEGDPGFNTVQHSAVEKRRRNRTMQKYTFFSAVLLFTLIIGMLLVTLAGGIISNISDRNDDDKPNKGPGKEDVEWGSLTVSATDTQTGTLVLVNDSHEYVFPASSEHLEEIYAVWVKHNPRTYQLGLSTHMDKTALVAMDEMLTDFATATGRTNVLVRYAYRTRDDQAALNSSIKPGFSDHHTGLGVDLKYMEKKGENNVTYNFSNDPTYAWITENAAKYGFVVRYPADKTSETGIADYESYYRYVGSAHATYMKAQNLCLEEYIATVKNYTQSKPLAINAADGNYYEVYYVAVNGSATVKYPTNYAYTISGTNEGGVIVTINRSEVLRGDESGADTTAGTTAAGTVGDTTETAAPEA